MAEEKKEMSAAQKIEEIEARRELRKQAEKIDRDTQHVLDLEALEALEQEHGASGLDSLDVQRFVKGFPTFVVIKTPSNAYYKRFSDQVLKAGTTNLKARREAQDLLAQSCWLYPAEEDAKKAMLEQFPGLLLSIAIRATKLVELKTESDEKS